jgi:hypothetical protein
LVRERFHQVWLLITKKREVVDVAVYAQGDDRLFEGGIFEGSAEPIRTPRILERSSTSYAFDG